MKPIEIKINDIWLVQTKGLGQILMVIKGAYMTETLNMKGYYGYVVDSEQGLGFWRDISNFFDDDYQYVLPYKGFDWFLCKVGEY